MIGQHTGAVHSSPGIYLMCQEQLHSNLRPTILLIHWNNYPLTVTSHC